MRFYKQKQIKTNYGLVDYISMYFPVVCISYSHKILKYVWNINGANDADFRFEKSIKAIVTNLK